MKRMTPRCLNTRTNELLQQLNYRAQGYVGLCGAMYGSVGLYVWVCRSMYGYVGLCNRVVGC